MYKFLGLDVVWVEATHEAFATLNYQIAADDRQKSFCALLTDADGAEHDFHIASNNRASSSIYALGEHGRLWPDIVYDETRRLRSITLQSLMRREHLSPRGYQALVLNVSGAELLVLKGAGGLLAKFAYVKARVSDFHLRPDSPTTADVAGFLAGYGYREVVRRQFASHPSGSVWDIVWARRRRPGAGFEPSAPILAKPTPEVASNRD